tara:strand:- start:207 stop:458 length:252 start_codon:yes stop_codon:yes gene_type:complete
MKRRKFRELIQDCFDTQFGYFAKIFPDATARPFKCEKEKNKWLDELEKELATSPKLEAIMVMFMLSPEQQSIIRWESRNNLRK